MNNLRQFIKCAGFINLLIILSLVSPSLSSANPWDSDSPGFLPYDHQGSQDILYKQPAQNISGTKVYLPIINSPVRKFIGIISPVYWRKENVEKFMPEVDALAGIKHASVGWGIDVQDPALYEEWNTEQSLNRNNLYRQLEQLWQKGYFSFIKIGSSSTIREIANGKYDNQLNQMAKIYKRWLENGGGRKAMFAPFQEMNGEWVPYYPANTSAAQKQKDFKDAYAHIINVFQANGIDRSKVLWVFAPNGWSWPEDNFEYYYPGDSLVDMIGFASYNFGYCDATVKADGSDYGLWENYDRIYEPYIRRIQTMAPQKYILISETGTSALTSKQARAQKQYNYAMKSEWLVKNYQYLASQPMVLGIYYFDFDDLGNNVGCDLAIPRSGFSGYREAVTGAPFSYMPIDALFNAVR